MAANQINAFIFYGLVPFADSLSLAAQAFVPRIHEKKPSPSKAKSMRKLLVSFLTAASFCGAALAGVMAIMPVSCRVFTSDPPVIHAVTTLVPIHFLISSAESEGILLEQKDLTFLGRMYAVFTMLIPWLFAASKKGC